MTAALLAAFSLGLMGSAHCVLMCGPLVAAMQPRHPAGILQLHGARIVVYAGLGALAGLAGAAFSTVGIGRWPAFVAAAVLAAQAILLWTRGTSTGPIGRLGTAVVTGLGARLRRFGAMGPVSWGVLNGLLPCGLVYSAVALSVGLAGVAQGAIAMTAFGLGTTPLLALMARPAASVGRRLAIRAPWLTPAALLLVAAMLVARGLHLHAAGH